MDNTRYSLLKKRANNCIDKLEAIRNQLTFNAEIHKTNSRIHALISLMEIIDLRGESFINPSTKRHLDLNYFEEKIILIEKDLEDSMRSLFKK